MISYLLLDSKGLDIISSVLYSIRNLEYALLNLNIIRSYLILSLYN